MRETAFYMCLVKDVYTVFAVHIISIQHQCWSGLIFFDSTVVSSYILHMVQHFSRAAV